MFKRPLKCLANPASLGDPGASEDARTWSTCIFFLGPTPGLPNGTRGEGGSPAVCVYPQAVHMVVPFQSESHSPKQVPKEPICARDHVCAIRVLPLSKTKVNHLCSSEFCFLWCVFVSPAVLQNCKSILVKQTVAPWSKRRCDYYAHSRSVVFLVEGWACLGR